MIEGDLYHATYYWDFMSPFWSNEKVHFLNQGDGSSAVKHATITNSLRAFHGEILTNKGPFLDIGSGGYPFMYLPTDISGRIVALDISRSMLLANKSKFKVIADASSTLPYKDESFNFVTMFFVNRYLGDQEQLLNEVVRVMKAGGRFIMLDFNTNYHHLEKVIFEPEKLKGWAENLGCTELSVKVITEGRPISGNQNLEYLCRVSLFTGKKTERPQRDSNSRPYR